MNDIERKSLDQYLVEINVLITAFRKMTEAKPLITLAQHAETIANVQKIETDLVQKIDELKGAVDKAGDAKVTAILEKIDPIVEALESAKTAISDADIPGAAKGIKGSVKALGEAKAGLEETMGTAARATFYEKLSWGVIGFTIAFVGCIAFSFFAPTKQKDAITFIKGANYSDVQGKEQYLTFPKSIFSFDESEKAFFVFRVQD
jgi:hypothetical protein